MRLLKDILSVSHINHDKTQTKIHYFKKRLSCPFPLDVKG